MMHYGPVATCIHLPLISGRLGAIREAERDELAAKRKALAKQDAWTTIAVKFHDWRAKSDLDTGVSIIEAIETKEKMRRIPGRKHKKAINPCNDAKTCEDCIHCSWFSKQKRSGDSRAHVCLRPRSSPKLLQHLQAMVRNFAPMVHFSMMLNGNSGWNAVCGTAIYGTMSECLFLLSCFDV